MTIQQLKYVITVAEKGSISEAAKDLYISQPSLSASIREGDAVLLVEVVRTGNRSLTVDGQPAEQIPADGGSHTILLTI